MKNLLLGVCLLLGFSNIMSIAAGESIFPLHDSGIKVRLGIDNIDKCSDIFKDKKTGLITNTTGMNSNLKSSIDVLKENSNLTTLFAPEHGLRGNETAGAQVGNETDTQTGLPVFSLYSGKQGDMPDENMLKNVDVLCYDIQDVGARFYTYISTMAAAMKSCKKFEKEFVVFDRPDPLSGLVVEGGIATPDCESFVGLPYIPVRYGLTCGELARFLNEKMDIHCKLTVIPMTGWKRNMFWMDTGELWIPTSPNIPTSETALVYSGTCLFEGTNVSEGRGTTNPFLYIGAPWIKAEKLAENLNALKLPQVLFRPVYFTPVSDKYKGELCGGVHVHVLWKKNDFMAVTTALAMIDTIKKMYPDKFEFRKPAKEGGKYWIDLLTGSNLLRTGGYSYSEIIKIWEVQDSEFIKEARKYYLYQDNPESSNFSDQSDQSDKSK